MLGSSVGQILVLLNHELVILVSVSLVIALPVSTLILLRWLQDFSIRVSINRSWFVPVVAIAFILAFVVTGVKALKAALVNPVKSVGAQAYVIAKSKRSYKMTQPGAKYFVI